MNVIRLMGGLGNQMFQYAFGQLQKQNGIKVSYDLSWFDNHSKSDTHREYILDKFYTDLTFSKFLKQPTVSEKEYTIALTKRRNCNFVGYWQCLDTYFPILAQLRKEFRVKEEFYTDKYLKLKKLITKLESVAVHVRRQDYLTTDGFFVLPFRYYLQTIYELEGNLFIFSDDIRWCKRAFKKEYFTGTITFVDIEDYLAFDLMQLCKHNITANSSFSSLAAFLNLNENKIVYAPKKWNTIEPPKLKERKEHLPKDWILC